MKQILLPALFTLFLITLSCKKNNNGGETYWAKKKTEIADKVAIDLVNIKKLLPNAIKSNTVQTVIDTKIINNYFGVSNTQSNAEIIVKKPQNIEEIKQNIIAENLKQKQLATIDGPDNTPTPTGPIVTLIGDGFRNQLNTLQKTI